MASSVASTFDVLSWFAPATITIKNLLQRLWEKCLHWDDPIPEELLPAWSAWRTELCQLTTYPIPRFASHSQEPVLDRQLHGFSNASQVAYGGVVYLRQLHSDMSVSVSLITSKTRVAPLSSLTIPRLELCGALLLSNLLFSVTQDLSIPMDHVYAWSDSSVVLGWLKMAPSRLMTFVANRVREICRKVPLNQWRCVSTGSNPADFASRGMSPHDLLQAQMWWDGPPWLQLSPDVWPRRPDINLSRELPESKAKVLVVKTVDASPWIKYSS